MLGSVTPRLWTRPLRDLSEPGASFGPLVSQFAREVLLTPCDPWQDWLLLHAGELLPDGRPRFRIVLVLVARQNGKTHVLVTLTLFWTLVEAVPLILGTSTKLDYAAESWRKAIEIAEHAAGIQPDGRPGPLAGEIPARRRTWVRQTNGEQEWNLGGCRYKVAAANEEGGRSLTIHRLVMDELRQHHDRSAWAAAVPAVNAVSDGQIWCLSNAGDVRSVVLNAERAAALRFIETGEGDPRVGLFEWSAPDGCAIDDVDGHLAANPNAGRRIPLEDLIAQARAAAASDDPDAVPTHRTEILCQSVPKLDPALDAARWQACGPGDGPAPTLADLRPRIALGLDSSPDGQHATLVAAAVRDDQVAVLDVVASWSGPAALKLAIAALPEHVARIRPRSVAWFPIGPAAAAAADLAERKDPRRRWPPRGVLLAPIRADAAGACMGFAGDVTAGRIAHGGDPLLDAHAINAEKQWRGATWKFTRERTGGHVDALYAAAAAAHAARTLPPSIGKPRVITSQ